MSPFVPGYATSPVQMPLGQTFGAVSIGVWAGCILFGMVVLSTIHYIGSFPQDPIHNKALVYSLAIVNLIYIASQCEMVYNWTIDNWGNVVVFQNTSWGWQGAVACLATQALLVQAYFAFRIWVLSGRKAWYIALLIVLLGASSFGFAMGTVYVTTTKATTSWAFYTYGNTCWLVLAAAADVVITVSMIVYLLKARTGFKQTERMIWAWIIHALETNAVTALGAIAEAALVAHSEVHTSQSMAYIGVAYAVTQLYPLSVLTALNSRTGLAADRVQGSTLSGLSSIGIQQSQIRKPAPSYSFNSSQTSSGMRGTDTMVINGATAFQEVHVMEEVAGEGDLYSKHPYAGKEFVPQGSFGNMVYVRDLEKGQNGQQNGASQKH